MLIFWDMLPFLFGYLREETRCYGLRGVFEGWWELFSRFGHDLQEHHTFSKQFNCRVRDLMYEHRLVIRQHLVFAHRDSPEIHQTCIPWKPWTCTYLLISHKSILFCMFWGVGKISGVHQLHRVARAFMLCRRCCNRWIRALDKTSSSLRALSTGNEATKELESRTCGVLGRCENRTMNLGK